MANKVDKQRASVKEESFTDIFFKYFYIVLKYKLLILLILIIIAPATFIVLKRREPKFTPLYKASARVKVITGLAEVPRHEGEALDEGRQLLIRKARDITMLMQSSVILEKVVKKAYNLGESDKNKIASLVKKLQGPKASSIKMQGIVPKKGNLIVESELNYIRITAIDFSPQISLGIVENLIEHTRTEMLSGQRQIVKETLASLERQLEEARRDLEEAKLKLTKFIVENKVVSKIIEITEDATREEEGPGFFSSDTDILALELVSIRSEVSKKEGFLKKVEALRSSSGNMETYRMLLREKDGLLDPDAFRGYLGISEEVKRLLLVNREAHPTVIKAKEALKRQEEVISQKIDIAINSLNVELEILKTKEKDLTTLIDQGLNNVMVEYSHLKRNVKVKQQLAEKVLDSVQQLNLVNKLISSASHFTVTDPPTLPKQPFNLYQKTKTSINYLLFSIIFGLGTGVAAAAVIDYLGMTVRDITEIEDTLGLRILGEIPVYGEGKAKSARHLLPLQKEPNSVASEAFRGLRTNIKFCTIDKQVNTLLVTSLVPKEGKTFITANLATAFAQTDKNVLIIDCDLRKSTLHRYFGLENKEGMVQLIKGRFNPKPVSTAIPNLYIMPAGVHPQNPAELLGSEAFDETLDRLKQGFDLIIIDSPPLFVVADATILIKKKGIDGAILIARADVTPKKALRRIDKTPEDIKEKIMGAVFNGIGIKKGKYGSYYYYQYDYYGEKGKKNAKGI